MFLPTVQCTVIRSPDVDSFFLCTTAVWVTKNLATELGEEVGTASYRVYPKPSVIGLQNLYCSAQLFIRQRLAVKAKIYLDLDFIFKKIICQTYCK